ncbi:MAG: ACT domain-containing protein [Thaumarchaeota archaeon]|nr:ACT domain-containing protein [Nitrososphaerota archaeon]
MSEAVSTIISGNYVVLESLKLKIVNYHALASRISSEVEELTGKKAKLATVVVAIKRFSDGLGEGRLEGMSAGLKDSKLELAGGMVDMTVAGKAAEHHRILQDFLKLEGKFSGTPYVFQLPNSVKIIAEEKDAKLLEETLWGSYETSLKRNVAKITIRLSPSAEKVPGIASFITELLYRNGVSILDAFLSYEDIVLVMQERLGAKAYQVLSEEISR